MVSSRVATAVIGLVASLLLSVVLWRAFGSPFFFLFVPFVPLLLRGRNGTSPESPPVQTCPACGFQTRNPEFDYCPVDGRRLEQPDEGPHR